MLSKVTKLLCFSDVGGGQSLGHLVERSRVAVILILRVAEIADSILVQSDLSVLEVILFLFVQPLPVLYLVQGHLLFDSSTNGPNIRNVAESVDSEALMGSFMGILRIGRLVWSWWEALQIILV